MSGKKSLEQIWQQMQAKRDAESQRQMAQERVLYEQKEKVRQEYLRRMRMFEKIGTNTPTSASSAGAGGGRLRRIEQKSIIGIFAQSYVISWNDSTDDIWKIAVFNFDSGSLSETINTELNYDDWLFDSDWRNIQNGGFTVIFEGNSYKLFFINANGNLIDIKSLDTDNYFLYTENAQGFLGEIDSISTFYHFSNDRVNTHQFPGVDVSNIRIDDGIEDDVTKDGSMVVEAPNNENFYIARPNGDLINITDFIFSNYMLDYNTDFILSRSPTSDPVKVVSIPQEGTSKSEIDLSQFGGLSSDTRTLFGENCGYYNFDINGEDVKLMVVYDGDFNRFITLTYSNNSDVYRTYTERNWYNPFSSFGKTLVLSSWSQSTTNNIGSITNRVELNWLPKGKEDFYAQVLEDENLIFTLGDSDIVSNRTFTHGENPIIMFATESHIQVGFLTSNGFVIESTEILTSSCSNIWGHNIGEKTFAVFAVGDIRVWQIYGENSIEGQMTTTPNWNWGSENRSSDRNGTLAVIDSGDASASNSFFYTPISGIQPLPVNNGDIYNQITHGNRTGISSDSQIITKKDESDNLEGFYLLTRNGLSNFIDLELEGEYTVSKIVVGDDIISLNIDSVFPIKRVIVYNKSNLELIYDSGDTTVSSIEQYGNRTIIEITDGEETDLILIHKNGVETLSINQNQLSYESNDSVDND
jgi:hypothetical protein